MKNLFRSLFCLTFCLFISINIQAQNKIKAKKGYSPQIGVMISMLDDLKTRITNRVENLDQNGTDFLIDENGNRIGAMILHLAATEKYYQLYTFEGRVFNEDEADWDMAQTLGAKARAELQGKPIDHYLKIWDEVRKETKRLLKRKDDKWFAEMTKYNNMNNHWAWYHVMEHQANHMGQIAFISKRIK